MLLLANNWQECEKYLMELLPSLYYKHESSKTDGICPKTNIGVKMARYRIQLNEESLNEKGKQRMEILFLI